jgi:hypothetical protein
MKLPSGSRMNENSRDRAERHRRRAFPNAHRHEASMLRFNNLIEECLGDSRFIKPTVCSLGSSGSSSSSSSASVPPWLSGLLSQSAGLTGELGRQSAPGLFSQLGSNPQQIAGVPPENLIPDDARVGVW